jgi:tryptophan halogenase
MVNRVEKITVVGGGTAGWVTALVVHSFLNAGRTGPNVEVTVIESPKIPTVGVGEATVSGMALLLNSLGIDEAAFIRRCNASFKLSVRFENWGLDSDGAAINYYHPFNNPPNVGGVVPVHHFNAFGPHSGSDALAASLVPNTAVVEGNRGPRLIGGRNYEHKINYAYHLDAGLFGEYLRDVAVPRGLRHIRDDVVEVTLDERGYVSALELENGGTYPVELVVDCTGFKGLILQQVLKEPFESFAPNLLCDRAIPLQIPHKEPTRLAPFTCSTALGAGWVWRVPLYSRLGTGYVFSSAFRTDDEARAEFLTHLRARGDLPADAPDPDTRVIHMKTGRTRRAWVNNCVAVGLAGGFVEPLESTAIYLIEMAARLLVGHLPDREINPVFAGRFNKIMSGLGDEIRDFIVSHYVTSNRPEPFWRAARDDIEIPDSLRENLDLWRYRLPSVNDTPGALLFTYWNYLYTLWPKGFFKGRHFPLEGSVSRTGWDRFGRFVRGQTKELMDTLPDHYELLLAIRGATPEHSGAAPDRARELPFAARAKAQPPTIRLP